MVRNFPRMVVSAAPLRLSFAGGGTDLPGYFEIEPGEVLSTTIDKFVYVTVKSHGKLFGEQYRLNYFETEHTDALDDIRNDIIRECLRLAPVEGPVYISTVADVPASSGLGSSSAFAVALLQALHLMRGERITQAQLAEEACHIEIDVLKHPIGKQDQYASAFGGLNHFTFATDGRVSIEPQPIASERVQDLFDSILLLWTGKARLSKDILCEQSVSIRERLEELRGMRAHCVELKLQLQRKFEALTFGGVLDETWRLKRRLAGGITSDQIESWYETACRSGASGGKIAGAGGGGFLLLIVPPGQRAAVCDALPELVELPVGYESSGTRILMPVGH